MFNQYDEILQCLRLFVREKERRKSLQDYELKKEHDLIFIWIKSMTVGTIGVRKIRMRLLDV